MTYREFVEHVKRSARNVQRGFTSPDDDWHPIAVGELPSGRPMVIPLRYESDDEKDVVVLALRFAAREFGLRKLALVQSAWMRTVDVSDPAVRAAVDADRYPLPRPSEAPDRVEIVHVTVFDAERTEACYAPILRSRRRPPKLGEWGKTYTNPDVEGRWVAIAEALR